MLTWLQTKALTLLVAAVPLGLIASLVYQGVKKLIERETELLAKTPAALHRVYFGIVATVLTAVAGALGITIDCPTGVSCLTALTPETITVGLEASLAIVVGLATHALKKKAGK